MEVIKSISFDEQEIIKNIIKLHCKYPIELDPTYSKGNFYKNGIESPKFKFDIKPQTEDTEYGNAEDLPINNNTIHTIMFDPPFLATTGKSLNEHNSSNKINKRFGVFPNEEELHSFYIRAMIEFYRILKKNGILIFKCQDKISSGTQYLSHNFIINQAERVGFYCKDIFILLAKNRIVADWQAKNQKHARKYHSYFLVLQKSDKEVNYTGRTYN